MNKWQIICPTVAAVVAVIILGSIHMRGQRRDMVSQQIESHAPQIGQLLTAMRGSNVSQVEDATFQELQASPSTAFISRSMVSVAPAGDGRLQCVIDTSSLGIPPHTIRSSQ